MPVIKKLVAHHQNEDNFWLKVDHSSRFIQNGGDEWQFLFNPNSTLSASAQLIKITGKFDDSTFTNLKIIAYLYDQQNSSIGNAASCEFKFYRISGTDWTETLILTQNGTQLSNNYFYLNPANSTLAPIDFFGADSLMIEATIIRSGITYRDRIYLNHLGIYDNVTRLRQDVQFLDLTKQDE